jgi:phosphoenolpyruvate carboxykinase (GTP)
VDAGSLRRQAAANETAIGNLPRPQDLNTKGLDISATDLQALLSVDPAKWQQEVTDIRAYLQTYGKRLPAEMLTQLAITEKKLAG